MTPFTANIELSMEVQLHEMPPGWCRRGGEMVISAWGRKVSISKRTLAVLNSCQHASRVVSATWNSAPNRLLITVVTHWF